MNFLAHIFLSGNNEQVILGNFFADSIKGSRYLEYPADIQKGILLHRAIDFYTDTHTIFRKSASRLFDNYRHYNGVIVDIYYDHFLAANWERYSDIPLKSYVENFYELAQSNYDLLPAMVKNFLPYMLKDNWLLSYGTLDGINRTLYQLNRRTKNVSGMDKAGVDLVEHYELFENEFFLFFEEIQEFAKEKRASLSQ